MGYPIFRQTQLKDCFFLRYGNPFETVMTWQADRKNVVFYWLLSDSVLGSKFAYFASQTTDLHRTDCEWDDVQPPPHQSPGLISTVVSIHGILKYIIYVIFCVYSVYIYIYIISYLTIQYSHNSVVVQACNIPLHPSYIPSHFAVPAS